VSIVGVRADETVRDLVLDYLDSPQFAKALALARREAEDSDRTLGKLQDQLVKDRARLEELGDSFADGEMDRVEYQRLSSRVQERIDEADRKLARLDVSGPSAQFEGQGEMLRAAWDAMTLEERRDVIRAVADRFTVLPAGKPANVFRPERIRPVWRY
jgi:hypothetical protein